MRIGSTHDRLGGNRETHSHHPRTADEHRRVDRTAREAGDDGDNHEQDGEHLWAEPFDDMIRADLQRSPDIIGAGPAADRRVPRVEQPASDEG